MTNLEKIQQKLSSCILDSNQTNHLKGGTGCPPPGGGGGNYNTLVLRLYPNPGK